MRVSADTVVSPMTLKERESTGATGLAQPAWRRLLHQRPSMPRPFRIACSTSE
jgi:hypothetical protein